MRRVQAFENWFRKLRTTQTDMLFNKIHDKMKHTTRSVQSQNSCSGRGQRRNCLNCSRRSYWCEGIVCCTCGHLLKETAANRSFIEYTLDLLSIPEYVIKKGRPHGHRYGKLPRSREYFLANNLEKRWKKKDYKGIHDRFLRDPIFRGRMIESSRDEEVCRAWDVLADEDHTYHMSEEEYFYYKNNW